MKEGVCYCEACSWNLCSPAATAGLQVLDSSYNELSYVQVTNVVGCEIGHFSTYLCKGHGVD